MDPWAAIRCALERQLRAASASETWPDARQQPCLRRFECVQDVLGFVMSLDEDAEAKNEVFTALVRLAQSGSQLGVLLLALALWPGLSMVRRRWRLAYRGREADLAADVVSTFFMRVHKLQLSKRSLRVAATLCRNTEHEFSNAHRSGAREPVSVADLDDSRAGSEHLAQRLELCDWIAQQAGSDAELCIRVMLDDEAATDVARDLAVPPACAWQRIHRASRRMRYAFDQSNSATSKPSRRRRVA